MDSTRLVEFLILVIGSVFAVYFYMNSIHASQKEVLEVKAELIDMDIRKDAEVRAYYKDKEASGNIDQADKDRLEYIEEELGRKYKKQEILQKALIE